MAADDVHVQLAVQGVKYSMEYHPGVEVVQTQSHWLCDLQFVVRVWDVLMSEGPAATFCFMLGVFETAKVSCSRICIRTVSQIPVFFCMAGYIAAARLWSVFG